MEWPKTPPFYYISWILCFTNSSRTWLGNSAPCGIDWGHLVVFSWWMGRSQAATVASFIHLDFGKMAASRGLGVTDDHRAFLPSYEMVLRLHILQLVSPTASISRGLGESYLAISDSLSEGHAESLVPYAIGQNSHRLNQIQEEGTQTPHFSLTGVSRNLDPIFF